jgi:hypothetical protein
MEGIEGLLDTVRQLLDIGKLDYVLEHVYAILDIFCPLPDVASLPRYPSRASSRTPLM